MSKKTSKQAAKAGPAKSGTAAAEPVPLPPLGSKKFFFTDNLWIQLGVIVVLCFGLNWNTFKNKYCLDDDIILRQNIYVQRGTAGIGDIFANDSYQSFYDVMNAGQQLANGRYRPLSVVTFAMEQQFFGKTYGNEFNQAKRRLDSIRAVPSPDQGLYNQIKTQYDTVEEKIRMANLDLSTVHHVFSVIWFAISMVVLFWFLRFHVFRSNTDIAFLAVLLFLVHPIHTEVIANVKSRDEIMSLLFTALCGIFIFRYDAERKMRDLWLGLGAFFLALLSKEYDIVLPFIFIVGVSIFHRHLKQNWLLPIVTGALAIAPIGLVMLYGAAIDKSQAWLLCFVSALLPLAFYRLMRPEKQSMTEWIMPMMIVVGVYMTIRHAVIGVTSAPDLDHQSVLNDPFLFLKTGEAEGSIWATKLSVLPNYMYLLFFPATLSADYSYATFPYVDITALSVWICILMYGGLLWLMFRLWQKRHPLAFPLVIFFGFFVLVCNIFLDLGATMGERLIYHSSLGFVMAIAWLVIAGAEKIKVPNLQRFAVLGFSVVAIGLMSWKTIDRNKAWFSDFTLFTTDVKTMPNSVLCNGNAGARILDPGLMVQQKADREHRKLNAEEKQYLHDCAQRAMPYFNTALKYDPRYVNGLLNRGLCWYYLGDKKRAADDWAAIAPIYKHHPTAANYARGFFMLPGNYYGQVREDYPKAIDKLTTANRIDPWSVEITQNLAGAYYTMGRFDMAFKVFESAIARSPNDQNILGGYNASKTYLAAQQTVYADSLNPNAWMTYAKNFDPPSTLYNIQEDAYRHVLKLQPDNTIAKVGLDSATARHDRLRVKYKATQKEYEATGSTDE